MDFSFTTESPLNYTILTGANFPMRTILENLAVDAGTYDAKLTYKFGSVSYFGTAKIIQSSLSEAKFENKNVLKKTIDIIGDIKINGESVDISTVSYDFYSNEYVLVGDLSEDYYSVTTKVGSVSEFLKSGANGLLYESKIYSVKNAPLSGLGISSTIPAIGTESIYFSIEDYNDSYSLIKTTETRVINSKTTISIGKYLINQEGYITYLGEEGSDDQGIQFVIDLSRLSSGDGDFGSAQNDVFIGSASNNSYYGFGGDDDIQGRDGDDKLNGDLGNDSLNGGNGNDTLNGQDGNDTLVGGDGNNFLNGGNGDDVYYISNRTTRVEDSSGSDTAYISEDFIKLTDEIEHEIYLDDARPIPYWIDALLPNEASGNYFTNLISSTRRIYYNFPDTLPTYIVGDKLSDGYVPFNEAQKAAARAALSYISTLINIEFVENSEADSANTISFANNTQVGSAGFSIYPSSTSTSRDVFINKNSAGNLTMIDGSYSSLVIIHELGHSLGLKHPFDEPDATGGIGDGPYLQGTEDSTNWTAMSYTSYPEQYHKEFKELDIAALQYIYGPSASSRSDNNIYKISNTKNNFLWDGAGVDVVDASELNEGATIHLSPGYWGFVGENQGPTIISPGQVTVNFGSIIENILGSGYADSLYGNEVSNEIKGGDGNDSLSGLSGDDILLGGNGNDTLIGGDGIDTASYSFPSTNYSVVSKAGGYQVSSLSGADGVDNLVGVERIQFSDEGGLINSFLSVPRAKFWHDPTKTTQNGGVKSSITLSDVLDALKLYLGKPISEPSPYKYLAADLDGNGVVNLTDVLSILKVYLGKSVSKGVEWIFVSKSVVDSNASQIKATSCPVVLTEFDQVDSSSVEIVGILRGDVNGSWGAI